MDTWQRYHCYPSPDAQMKKDTIIERKREFPGRLCTAIDENKGFPTLDFLSRIESKLAELLFENSSYDKIDESKGLNCDRDTEAEVELAIRFFPHVLSKTLMGRYLICWQLRNRIGEYNLKAVSFIPLLAKLGIERNLFIEEERGGLTDGINGIDSNNLLKNFANNYLQRDEPYDEAYQKRVDNALLAVMKKLRENGLFKKEDIRECDMMRNLCKHSIFPEQRFRYLADWDPSCLMIPSDDLSFRITDGWLLIHYATNDCKDIRGFRTVFDVGIRHFPMEMGGLFRRGGDCPETAYQMACKKFGNEEVKKILDDGFRKNHKNINALLKSLVYAATEETVHLDGVFEVLRREPSVFLLFK